jgi:predicted DNA-binding transcriptional regulator YafY
MKNYISDIIRQAEILAESLNGAENSKSDYECYYDVSPATIDRDLDKLRSFGIEIYSKKKVVKVLSPPPKEALIRIAADYLPLKLNSDIFSKTIKSLSKTSKTNFYQFIILISKAVKENIAIIITYQRGDGEINSYKIKPLSIINNGFNWVFYAEDTKDNITKTFFVTRIKKLELTKTKFYKTFIEVDNIDKYKLILRFNPIVIREIEDKIWFDEYSLENDENGFLVLRTEQSISIKLAAWCISWWDKLEILHPIELKDYIGKMIYDFTKINNIAIPQK